MAIIKKSWIVFEAVACWAFVGLVQIGRKEDLHKRSGKKLRMFRKLVAFVGKLLRIRGKIRFRKGLEVKEI